MYEIERKFLIKEDSAITSKIINNYKELDELYKQAVAILLINQTYITNSEHLEERVRKIQSSKYLVIDRIPKYVTEKEFDAFDGYKEIIEEVKYFFTQKYGHGIKRIESEIEISELIYKQLLSQKIGKSIVKTRYVLENPDTSLFKEIVIDYYNTLKVGLVVSEVEYVNESFIVHIPDFLKNYIVRDISFDKRYANKQISLL